MIAAAPRYEILGHLATGGMGEILLARRLGPAGFAKLVVLKRPLAHAPGAHRLTASLVAEARLLARISHPNVCQIHDLEEADGQYFLALELLEGLSLWSLLAHAEASGRPIAPRIACGMFAQICDGLSAIHQLRALDGSPARVVHRDISPGNLFLTETGLVKILDLGIAKHADSEDLTPFGSVKGKLPYLSPEQAAGKELDARADLFALGLVLYDLARGRRPASDRIGALAAGELELDELPAPLAEVIGGALQRDPERRFSSAAELGAALASAGAALGGAASGAELAEWLTRDHADALEQQRARLRAALAGARPRALTLRSAIEETATQVDLRQGEEEGGGEREGEWRGATEELLARTGTERLAIDDEARPRGAAHRASAGATKSRRAGVVGGALLAIAMAAVALAIWRWPEADAPQPMPAPAPAPAPATAPAPIAVAPRAAQPPSLAAAPPDGAPAAEPLRRKAKRRAIAAVQPAPAASSAWSVPSAAVSPGQLTVGSMPWADVRIGGRLLRTDVWRLELPPGRHRLHARTGDGREQERAFQIESGKETRIVLDWSKR